MPPSPATARDSLVPLCVDLDGTLIKTDLLWESLARLLKRNPFYLLLVLFWWTRGRAFLKRQIAARIELDVTALPYNDVLMEFLRDEKRKGRQLVLATASDRALAAQVADHVGLFDEVLASDGKTNLRARTKAQALTGRFGEHGFDYAGNSSPDLAVWAAAREAIVVNAGASLAEQAGRRAKLDRVFARSQSRLPALIQCLRPNQWVKNLIVFVPLLASHQLANRPLLLDAVGAFVAFCLCASGVHVLNDLLNLDADRHHPAKKSRPFAAGDLPLPVGLALAPLLVCAGTLAAVGFSQALAGVLAVYFVFAASYSWRVKQIALLDVFFLAALYMIRLIAGHVATGVAYSPWLLVFSMLIFVSLALVRPFVKLTALRQQNEAGAKESGYMAENPELLASLGSGCGYLAVIVLALYVNSSEARVLYRHPALLLLVCPLLFYWISRVWRSARRGRMRDDPIVFAATDPASCAVGALTLLVLWLATGH